VQTIDALYAQARINPSIQLHIELPKILESWYVVCSITDELIPFSEMKYWDVDKNLIFKDAKTSFEYYKWVGRAVF